jgi:peptide/nickel transport system permease protein
MARFLAGRLFAAVVSILLLAAIAFIAIHLLLPYDWSTQFALGNVEGARALREQLGIDRPIVVQLAEYMGRLVRADLGLGFDGRPVGEHVFAALPVTMAVFAVGGMLAFLLGHWMGRVVAWQRRASVSAAMTGTSLLMLTAFPPLLIFLIVYFGGDRFNDTRAALGYDRVPFGALPTGPVTTTLTAALVLSLGAAIVAQAMARRHGRPIVGALALPSALAGMALALAWLGIGRDAADVLLHPSFVVALLAFVAIAFGEIMLVMRTGMTAEKPEDYVTAARAKGMSDRWIRDRHVAPNAVIPALSRFFAGVPFLLTGLIIIERQLGLHGLSSVFFGGIENANVPLVVGTLVMVGVLVAFLRLVLDVVHAVIDPRIRLGSTS